MLAKSESLTVVPFWREPRGTTRTLGSLEDEVPVPARDSIWMAAGGRGAGGRRSESESSARDRKRGREIVALMKRGEAGWLSGGWGTVIGVGQEGGGDARLAASRLERT